LSSGAVLERCAAVDGTAPEVVIEHRRWKSSGLCGLIKSSLIVAMRIRLPEWVISDVLSARQPLPPCPRFQTYRCLAANEVQGPILLNKSGGNPKRQADIFTASSV